MKILKSKTICYVDRCLIDLSMLIIPKKLKEILENKYVEKYTLKLILSRNKTPSTKELRFLSIIYFLSFVVSILLILQLTTLNHRSHGSGSWEESLLGLALLPISLSLLYHCNKLIKKKY